jgi:hypothetical protein
VRLTIQSQRRRQARLSHGVVKKKRGLVMFRLSLAFFLAAVVLALLSLRLEGNLTSTLATLSAAVSSIFLIAGLRRLSA